MIIAFFVQSCAQQDMVGDEKAVEGCRTLGDKTTWIAGRGVPWMKCPCFLVNRSGWLVGWLVGWLELIG